MANPPFAGDIKDSKIITKYELGKKYETKTVKEANAIKKLSIHKGWVEKISRDILFIERNLNMLKPGGRMAIVLPQGRFNNSTDKIIRDFIAEHCRILAVVGLHGNTFKPHTGTKTSVLFVQKWDNKLCPRKDDYNIFFATQKVPGKDNSGEKIYESEKWIKYEDKIQKQEFNEPLEVFLKSGKKTEDYIYYHSWENDEFLSKEIANKKFGNIEKVIANGKIRKLEAYYIYTQLKRDKWGHYIVKHDLYNTDSLTHDGIAEAFIEFGKKEQLSFF